MKQVLGSEVPVEDAGFRHGLGVFETVLVKEGVALFADWHWESLCEAARVLGLDSPISFPLDLPPGDDGIWRWFHTESGIRATWEEGVVMGADSCSLRVSPICHASLAWTSRYKTLSYLDNLQARLASESDDALFLNEHGQVATASMANIFWVKDRILFTPSTDCGCRAGVIRRWILEGSGTECRQVQSAMEELMGAEEIFVTNSRIGILPVRKLEGIGFETGKVTQSLQERYSACRTPVEE